MAARGARSVRSPAEAADDLGVQQPVAADRRVALVGHDTVAVRGPAAGPLDEQAHGREIVATTPTASTGTSSAPSATRQCCQKSPSPHARRASWARPTSAGVKPRARPTRRRA